VLIVDSSSLRRRGDVGGVHTGVLGNGSNAKGTFMTTTDVKPLFDAYSMGSGFLAAVTVAVVSDARVPDVVLDAVTNGFETVAEKSEDPRVLNAAAKFLAAVNKVKGANGAVSQDLPLRDLDSGLDVIQAVITATLGGINAVAPNAYPSEHAYGCA
jgi:hypothetical protein